LLREGRAGQREVGKGKGKNGGWEREKELQGRGMKGRESGVVPTRN